MGYYIHNEGERFMSNLVQIWAADNCGGLKPIVSLIKHGFYPLVQIAIPIILIIYGIIDLGKAVIASDEKEIKAAQNRLIKRCIYAALIFFVVTLVSVIMDIVAKGATDESNSDSWSTCWRSAAIVRVVE